MVHLHQASCGTCGRIKDVAQPSSETRRSLRCCDANSSFYGCHASSGGQNRCVPWPADVKVSMATVQLSAIVVFFLPLSSGCLWCHEWRTYCAKLCHAVGLRGTSVKRGEAQDKGEKLCQTLGSVSSVSQLVCNSRGQVIRESDEDSRVISYRTSR